MNFSSSLFGGQICTEGTHNAMTPIEQLGQIAEEAKTALEAAASVSELETVEVQYLGAKAG